MRAAHSVSRVRVLRSHGLAVGSLSSFCRARHKTMYVLWLAFRVSGCGRFASSAMSRCSRASIRSSSRRVSSPPQTCGRAGSYQHPHAKHPTVVVMREASRVSAPGAKPGEARDPKLSDRSASRQLPGNPRRLSRGDNRPGRTPYFSFQRKLLSRIFSREGRRACQSKPKVPSSGQNKRWF